MSTTYVEDETQLAEVETFLASNPRSDEVDGLSTGPVAVP